ncbi:MAG: hypothetical protein ACOH1P_01935 [Lysobacter sp.]
MPASRHQHNAIGALACLLGAALSGAGWAQEMDIDRMWVSLNLLEDQFGGIRVGRRLLGYIPALNLEDVAFEVYFISPAGDFATWRSTRQSSGYDVRSFEVRVRPLQRIEGFRPGMSVLFAWPPAD